jgi:hypothetical protein
LVLLEDWFQDPWTVLHSVGCLMQFLGWFCFCLNDTSEVNFRIFSVFKVEFITKGTVIFTKQKLREFLQQIRVRAPNLVLLS